MFTNKLYNLIFSFLILLGNVCFAQNKVDYKEIDILIEENSMIEALNAINLLKDKYRKDSLNPEYWLRYSKASYLLYNYEDAKSSIKKAIKFKPNNSEYYFEKAILHNKIGELEISLKELENALKLNKKGKYYFWKGIVNQRLNKKAIAEIDYQLAIDNKFENAELYNNFAILLSENKKYEKALVMINKAILLNKNYSQAYSARSKINFFLLNMDSSCLDRNTAINLGYTNVFFIPDSICEGNFEQKINYASDLLASNNFYNESIKGYTKLIENKILKSDNFLNRGYCYFKLKDYNKAEKDYLYALSLENPAKDIIFDNLSLLYFELQNFLKSIEYSTKRIDLNPNNHVPYIDRGLCYRKLKEYEKAESDFNKSLEIKRDFFRAYGYRSFLFLELGQFQKSYDDATKSIKLNPEYGYGYLILAQAKQKLGMSNFCLDFTNAKLYGESSAEEGLIKYCK